MEDVLEAKDVMDMYEEWTGKLRNALLGADTSEICESSRMVLSVGCITHAYFPEQWTESMSTECVELFDRSYERASKLATTDEQRQHVKNIENRVGILRELVQSGWAVPAL